MTGLPRYILLAVVLVLAVAIAVIFDSPTSVFLLVGLALLALAVEFGSRR